MDQQAPGSGSRETRLLLATIAISIVMLVVLARFRFPDHGPLDTAQPAPAPLERLAAQASYDELAATMADLDRKVRPGLTLVRIEPRGSFAAAIRVTPDRAVVRLEPGETTAEWQGSAAPTLLGRDPQSGIAVLALDPNADNVVTPRTGVPRTGPRYVAVVDASAHGLALRPIYVGATSIADDGASMLSLATAPQTVRPGAPLFTFAGTFVGIATTVNGVVAVVPGDALKTLAENPPPLPGIDLGIEVEPLTSRLARAAGASEGVAVAAVAEGGPASGVLAPGDVVQSLDGTRITSAEAFATFVQTRVAGAPVAVTFVRRGKAATVDIAATPTPGSR